MSVAVPLPLVYFATAPPPASGYPAFSVNSGVPVTATAALKVIVIGMVVPAVYAPVACEVTPVTAAADAGLIVKVTALPLAGV